MPRVNFATEYTPASLASTDASAWRNARSFRRSLLSTSGNFASVSASSDLTLATIVKQTKVCSFWTFQQGVRQHIYCQQRRNNDAGASKKCAVLFVACFTHGLQFGISTFFSRFITFTELASGQLLLLGLRRSCAIDAGDCYWRTLLRAQPNQAAANSERGFSMRNQ